MTSSLRCRSLLLIGSLLSGLLLLACSKSPTVDERLVGRWQELSSRWKVAVRVEADGSYATTIEGHGSPAPEKGRLEARDGTWKLVRDDGRNNEGTYAFRSDDVVVLQGKHGPITWVRWGRETGETSDATAPAPLQADWPIAGLPTRAKTATTIARAWHEDAQLIDIATRLLPSANTEPFNVQTPRGHAVLAFHFCSPSAGTRLLVAPSSPAGEVVEQGMASCEKDHAIPQDFLDLPDAVARARDQGMAAENPGAAEIMYSYAARPGETSGWVWRIRPSEGSGDRVYIVPLGVPRP